MGLSKIKKYLPVERFVLESNLPVEEVINRLQNEVAPKQVRIRFGLKPVTNKPYEGNILGNTFTMNRVINYRNSFVPIITGTITTFLGKTYITIQMKPFVVVSVFMSIWLGIIGLVSLVIITLTIVELVKGTLTDFSPTAFIPLVMFVFGYMFTIFSFKAESNRSKSFLMNLFQAQPTSFLP